eukprot:460910_1
MHLITTYPFITVISILWLTIRQNAAFREVNGRYPRLFHYDSEFMPIQPYKNAKTDLYSYLQYYDENDENPEDWTSEIHGNLHNFKTIYKNEKDWPQLHITVWGMSTNYVHSSINSDASDVSCTSFNSDDVHYGNKKGTFVDNTARCNVGAEMKDMYYHWWIDIGLPRKMSQRYNKWQLVRDEKYTNAIQEFRETSESKPLKVIAVH